jgi:hypothetical protein
MLSIRVVTSPGNAIVDAGIPAGEVAAIVVDNPSASWVWMPATNDFIPPYTLGWGMILPNRSASVNLQFPANGPDGTASVMLGDNIVLTLYDSDAARVSGVSNYPGRQFVPITRKKIIIGTMPVTTGLNGMGFSGADAGRHIGSIVIDNKSQAWLQLTTYHDTIPPNTVGWAKTFPDAPKTLTITAMAAGPDGSPSVQLGDAPNVTLFDDLSAGNDKGHAYIPIARTAFIIGTMPVAASLTGIAFTGADAGRLIGSVIIDNKSQAWLQLSTYGDTIPPNTVGWAKTFPDGPAAITILAMATGPDGSASVQLGDGPNVTLLDNISAGNDKGHVYVPVARTAIIVGTMPVAASLTGIGFTGADAGRLIGSILVDNKSQAWLQLSTYGDTIPPNTVGWAKTFPDGPATITILAMATGPDGSASIQLGDGPNVTLFDSQTAGDGSGNIYSPIARTQRFTTVAFANFGVIAFTAANVGRLIAGCIIDNPSGAWLTLTVGGRTFRIAPYTLRWVKRVDPPTLNVTSLTFDAAGPAGQLSTRQGDQVSLHILDLPPDASDTAFIDGFTPTLTATYSQAVPTSIGVSAVALVAGVANKRIRVLNIVAVAWTFSQNLIPDCNYVLEIASSATSNPNFTLNVGVVPVVLPGPIDFPTGEGITMSIFPEWKNLYCQISVFYQLI